MTLRDFLNKHVNVGEVIALREKGWQIGIAQKDNDDLYLQSLHPRLLDLYEVVNFAYEERNWAAKHVLVVEILPTYEVMDHVRKSMV